MSIYTKTGDQGMTGLFSGRKISKASKIPQALGALDELNSALGAAVAQLKKYRQFKKTIASLEIIQSDLFYLGGFLAGAPPDKKQILRLEKRVGEWEAEIDRIEAELPSLKTFILPGGSWPGALLHQARSVSRRAERQFMAASLKTKNSQTKRASLKYLNRLSDYLFIFARRINQKLGIKEKLKQ